MSNLTPSRRSEREEICAVCNISTKQTCSSCKKVYYCSREHQKSDWKSHSKNCRNFEFIDDVKLGRHYIATRKIEIDELVFCENKPLLIIPHQGTAPICLSCYAPLRHENAKPCDKCGWPLCLDCTKHGPECELTMKYRESKVIISDFATPLPIYDAISVLRALDLRERKPKDYQKFLDLKDHCVLMAETGITGSVPMSIYDVADVVKAYMKIDDLDTEEIVRIIGIVGVNGFGIKTAENNNRVVVFDKPSYISHSCRPNCRAAIILNDSKNGPRIVIRAAATISKGDPVTITYTNPFRGTARRRSILRATKFFDCTCERCKDPTEFGSMLCAVKCFEKECAGYMLPPTFLVPRDKIIPNFVCDKCNLATPSATIDEMMQEISMKFSQIDERNTNQLKKFINEQAKILHENHYYIFEAKLKLSEAFTHEINNNTKAASEKLFVEAVTLSKQLNYLINILAPNVYGTRGSLLYCQFQYMTALRNLQSSRNASTFLRSFKESKKVLAEAYRYLRYDPVGPTDTYMAEAARLQLEELNNIEDQLF